MKKRSFPFLIGFFLAVLLLQNCKEEKYTFDFLPAGAIRYTKDTVLYPYATPIIDTVKIRSEVGLDSVMGYSLTIRSLSDTSIFLTKLDTTFLNKKITSFTDVQNYVFIDTLSKYANIKNFVGYMVRTWDKHKQRSQKIQTHILDIGIQSYSTTLVNNFVGITGNIAAQGAGKVAIPSSLSKAVTYYTTPASDTAAVRLCPYLDFIVWHDGTNYQFRSIYDVKTNTGTQFFAANVTWSVFNHTLFKDITGTPGFSNINTAITANDLNTIDWTGVTAEVVNLTAKHFYAFKTAKGKVGVICVTSFKPNATLNKSTVNFILKVQK
ncbi:MAG: hypothetical protein Q8928_15405 [Bacteroidota bacterium]|nr:hypothetical protein [Bacteroidota bacterium]